MLKRTTINNMNKPYSLVWRGDEIVDWVTGYVYNEKGEFRNLERAYGYKFNSAIQSDNDEYTILYEKLGTKALILKNGELIREINRSYYCASCTEYPIAFLKLNNGEYAVVHCPNSYKLLEIELVESGIKITSIENRNPQDCFHSRLIINQSNTILMNTGWNWHPLGTMELYDLNAALEDNSILDDPNYYFPHCCDVSSAGFLNDNLIVISSTNECGTWDEEDMIDPENLNPQQIGILDINQNKFIKKVHIKYDTGTLIPVNEDLVIDLYDHPKLINLNTGKVIQRFRDIKSGHQISAYDGLEKVPPMAIDYINKRIAIATANTIEILTIE